MSNNLTSYICLSADMKFPLGHNRMMQMSVCMCTIFCCLPVNMFFPRVSAVFQRPISIWFSQFVLFSYSIIDKAET